MPCRHKRTIHHTMMTGISLCLDCNKLFNNGSAVASVKNNLLFSNRNTHDEWKELNKGMEPENV